MVRASRVARGGSDALIFFTDQILIAQFFFCGVAPEIHPDEVVEVFGESFGEAIGEGFDQDAFIVIVLRFEFAEFFFYPEAGGDGESADVVYAVVGEEVGEAEVWQAFGFLPLLPQEVSRCDLLLVVGRIQDIHGVTIFSNGEESEDSAGFEAVIADDFVEHFFGVLEKCTGLCADDGIFEDGRVLAGEFPGAEEGGPVDKVAQCCQRKIPEGFDAQDFGCLWRRCFVVEFKCCGSCFADGHEGFIALFGQFARSDLFELPGIFT